MPCLLKIYDLANVKPHIHTSVTTKPFWASLTVSWLKLPVWTLLIIFFSILYSSRDLSRGWRNQFNLGIVPKCGQLKLGVSHRSIDQCWDLLYNVMDKLHHGSRTENLPPQLAAWMSPIWRWKGGFECHILSKVEYGWFCYYMVKNFVYYTGTW